MSRPQPDTPRERDDDSLRRQLLETQARYQALVEQIPAILYEDVPSDEPGTFESTYVGPQIERILGITPDAYINDPVDQWVTHLHPDDQARAVAEYREAIAAGGPLVQEYRWVRDDGRIVWIRDEFTIVAKEPREAGGTLCIQGVMFDITEFKDAEAAIGRQVALLEKVHAIGKEFTDLVLQGADLGHILRGVSAIVAAPVVLEDAAHQVVDVAGEADDVAAALRTWDGHSRVGHEERDHGTVHAEEGPAVCTWIPIALRNRAWGRIHVPGRLLDDVDRLALDRAAAAVALTLHSEQHVAHLTDHERGALMSDIWEGRFTSASEVLQRARRLGTDLEGRTLVAMVIEPVNIGADSRDLAEDERRRARVVMIRETRAAITEFGATGLSAPVGDRVLVIIGMDAADPATARKAGERICERLREHVSALVVSVGLSAAADTGSLRQALAQADEAAAYGARDARRSTVNTFEDLGIHHLLLRLSDGPELAHFVESQLAPLMDHDAKSSSPLLPTLRAFLANGGHKAETARTLHLERRSLYYRLERIERLLVNDLDDPETRIQLEIAVRGLDLLRQRSGPVAGT